MLSFGSSGPTLTHLPDMPYPHADDVDDGAKLMGLTFFAGGGGAVSVWNSSENQWLATQLCKYIHIVVKCGPRQYEKRV